ncbi:tetratricopeptide repeat protein [Methylopila henanensis]|uniref:Tetratricopeptide repeat protein n=1 Tax=Methylopila henanensis TaxID=873516 RepID=A0ABW4K5R7_9HYPH
MSALAQRDETWLFNECAKKPANVAARAQLARLLIKQSRHDDALDVLRDGLKVARSPDLLLELAICQTRTKDFAAAAATLRDAERLAPGHSRLPILKGELADAAGDLREAEAIFAADSAAYPGDPTRTLRWAKALIKLGRQREAIDALDAGLSFSPEAVGLLVERAALLRQDGRFEAARGDIETLSRVSPGHFRIPILTGELAEATGQFVEAEAVYARDVEAHPADPTRRMRWIRVLGRLSRPDQAIAVLSDGLELNPDAVGLLIERAALLKSVGRIDDAQADVDAVMRLQPGHSRLPALRAGLAEAALDYAAAEAIYARDAREHPGDSARRIRWSRALGRLGRRREALACLTVDPQTDTFELAVERAIQFRVAGFWGKAREELAALEARRPGDRRLVTLRADLASAMNDPAEAERLYAASAAENPLDPGAQIRWARALGRQGRDAEAAEVLAAALERRPDAEELLIEQCEALLSGDDAVAAARAIDRLEAAHPYTSKLAGMRARQATLSGDLDGASEAFRRDAERFPDDPSRRLRWLRSLRNAGKIETAIDVLRAIPSRSVADEQLLVECLLDCGRWAEAEQVLEVWPPGGRQSDAVRLRFEMTLAFLRQDYPLAMRLARAALETAPNDAKSAAWLALAAANMFDDALAWETLLLVPSNPAGGAPRLDGHRFRHLFGQIVNELRLNPEDTRALAAALREGDEALLRAAAGRAAADASGLGPAVGLLLALSRTGRLARARRCSSGTSRIPRTLHQYWDRDPPPEIRYLMDRAASVNRDLEYKSWDDQSARAFLGTLSNPEPLKAYSVARHAAMRADILRLALLSSEGGVYLDADDYCAAPLSTLIEGADGLVSYQEFLGTVGNNFVAASPGHPVVTQALEEATAATLQGAGESLWLATGPGLLTRHVASHIARRADGDFAADVRIWDLPAFRRVVYAARSARYKRAGKHWAATY